VLHIPDAEGGSTQPKVGEGTNQEEDDGWTTVTHGGRPTQTGDDQVPATTQVMAPSTMITRSERTIRPPAWMESFNVQQSGSTNSERLKAMRDIADSASEDEEEEATTEEILEAEEVDAGEMEEMTLISVNASPVGIKESWATDKYHHRMGMLLNPGRKGEYNLVGVGGGFVNTKELHVMKYKQAMATQDQASWTKAVQEEHERMVHHGVFKVTSRTQLPHGIKVLTSTWAMKKKSNGTYRARLKALCTSG
jgi:hypothetical protein